MQSSSFNSQPTPEDVNKLMEELPKMLFMESMELCKWEGFWFGVAAIKPIITFISRFRARDDDVFLTSTMKTGTTWLKALVVCIMQNHQSPLDSQDFLSKENPHFLVPSVESVDFQNKPPPFDINDDASFSRLLHTHLPYSVLPDSLKNSEAKIVYIARNPKDTLISMWHFFNTWLRPNQEPFSLEKMVDCFCSGFHLFGPFFEHVVEYWEESKKRPQKVLFVKYEELKSDPEKEVMRIAKFLERTLADEGEAAKIVQRCCLERLKNLEVNKNGSIVVNLQNSSFFRKGEVADWKNYLTLEMEMKINEMCRLKLEPLGLFL